jgi:hypothetical protein
MRNFAGNRLTAVLIFVASFASLLVGTSYSWAGDTLPAEKLPVAFLRNGGPDFTGLEPAEPAVSHGFVRRGGRVVSVYPLLPGLLHCPVVLAAHVAGVDVERRHIGLARLSAAWIAAAATAFFFLALVPLVRRETALLFTGVFLLGTEVFSVAGRGLWQHGSALLFINLSLALLVRGGRRVRWAGMSLAVAVAARPTTLLLAVLLTFWVARRRRDELPGFLLLAAIPAAALAAYSALWLGSPFAMGQGQSLSQFGPFSPEALLGILMSPSRGLFVYSPILVIGIFGILRLRQVVAGAETRSLLVHAALFAPTLVFFCSFWPNWWGGHSFGYRIVSELIPVLLIPAAIAWEAGGRHLRALALVLAAVSICVHSLGAYAPSDFNRVPDNIDAHPERLWDVRDSDLARMLKGAVGSSGGAFRD